MWIVVVEAVVENPKVKAAVLGEVEGIIGEDAVLASNTSTIPISLLAKGLKRPQNFCGMHFFNPVHRMPLVEIIRGEQTSDETINRVVAYAAAMGKSPVVVNDCPGFFVNRVLFPYFFGFNKLVADGADFAAVDKVMEKEFGWPMGPAYLLDVVGIDTGHHAGDVMAQGFPARMSKEGRTAIDVMYEVNRFGQKNGKGFYAYEQDKKGKPKKVADAASYELLAPIAKPKQDFDKDAIIARMMIPMINEVVLCLEEGIVATPAEADIALVYGLGFPPFRGGVFRYLDTIGLDRYVAMADQYADLGPALPRQRQAARDGCPGQNLLLIAERRSIHERRSHCRLYPDPDGPVQGRRLPQRACRRSVRAPDEIHPAAQPQPRPERDRGYLLGLRAADPGAGLQHRPQRRTAGRYSEAGRGGYRQPSVRLQYAGAA